MNPYPPLFLSLPSLEEMEKVYEKVMHKAFVLIFDYNQELKSSYWNKGCRRRLQTIVRCVSNIFTILPYRENSIYPVLDTGKEEDINVFFNSFLINNQAFLNNIAYIIHDNLPSKEQFKKSNEVTLYSLLKNKKLSGELLNLVKKFLSSYESDKIIRNRSAHRQLPFYSLSFNSKEDYNDYMLSSELARKNLSEGNLENYDNYNNKANSKLHSHGIMISDEEGEIAFIIKIHGYLLEKLNNLLSFTKDIISCLIEGYEFKSYLLLQDPDLVNFNWRCQ